MKLEVVFCDKNLSYPLIISNFKVALNLILKLNTQFLFSDLTDFIFSNMCRVKRFSETKV